MADLDITLEDGAARVCRDCEGRIVDKQLSRKLELVRDLEAVHFFVCSDCLTIIDNNCERCGGGVYVPRQSEAPPTLCPACRNDIIQQFGTDPGWHNDSNQ